MELTMPGIEADDALLRGISLIEPLPHGVIYALDIPPGERFVKLPMELDDDNGPGYGQESPSPNVECGRLPSVLECAFSGHTGNVTRKRFAGSTLSSLTLTEPVVTRNHG